MIQLINDGAFDFTRIGGGDFTTSMREYYVQSIEGKNESDELYGMLPASIELVEIINQLIEEYHESSYGESWRAFACYYAYYGPEA